MIDVVNSKQILTNCYPKYHKLHNLFDYVSIELLKLNDGKIKQTLRNDENNKLLLIYADKNKYKDKGICIYESKDVLANLVSNPMVLGDCACYCTNNNTITDEQFINIVKTGIKKFNIDFELHFKSAQYETDKYDEGGKKLYKGYMLPLLEHYSKLNGQIIKHDILEK